MTKREREALTEVVVDRVADAARAFDVNGRNAKYDDEEWVPVNVEVAALRLALALERDLP